MAMPRFTKKEVTYLARVRLLLFAICLTSIKNRGNMNIQKEGNTVDGLPDIIRIKNNRYTWSGYMAIIFLPWNCYQ